MVNRIRHQFLMLYSNFGDSIKGQIQALQIKQDKFYILMGSSQNKDPNLFIYITLGKRFYYAGETLEGTVHIDCKADCSYTQLFLRLYGSECVHWEEVYEKTHIHYNNFKDTYNEELLLSNFPNGIKTGHYSLPFSLLLPAAFPASFEYQQDNYIRYTLSAYFPTFSQKSPPTYQKILHLRQPPRAMPVGFRLQQIAQAQFWGCCCVCGSADLTFQSQTSGLMYGKPFLARGIVDNTRGSTNIKGFKVVLRESMRQISDRDCTNVEDLDEYVLFSSDNSVPVGSSLPFNAEIKVPVEALGYTAIGNIIYRAYFLELVAEVNCCYSNPRASRHVIFNTSVQPPMDEQEVINPPEGWSPNVYPLVSFLNLRPYVYQPNHLIDVNNQNGMAQPMTSMNQASLQQMYS